MHMKRRIHVRETMSEYTGQRTSRDWILMNTQIQSLPLSLSFSLSLSLSLSLLRMEIGGKGGGKRQITSVHLKTGSCQGVWNISQDFQGLVQYFFFGRRQITCLHTSEGRKSKGWWNMWTGISTSITDLFKDSANDCVCVYVCVCVQHRPLQRFCKCVFFFFMCVCTHMSKISSKILQMSVCVFMCVCVRCVTDLFKDSATPKYSWRKVSAFASSSANRASTQ